MALQPSIGNIPPGAVQVDRKEAAAYQYQQIKEWPHFRDVWPFKVGVPLLAGLAGCSALVLNRHFRLKVKLRNQGVIATQISTGVASILFATAPHITYVTQDLFLNLTPCPLCIETRAALLQVFGAVLYPSVAAPLANFFLATRLGTYRLPYFADGNEIFNLWLKLMKPIRGKLVVLVAVNCLAAGFITYKEAMSLETIRWKLTEFAKQLRDEAKRKQQQE